jgi:hypothetical protein
MPRRRTAALALAVAAVVAGCSSSPDGALSTPQSRMLFSISGEPLSGGPLGRPTCEAALGRWFDRVDANHDAAIALDEALADAEAQFRRMDLDRDGGITAFELQNYRMPYLDPRRERIVRQRLDVDSENQRSADNDNDNDSGESRSRRRRPGPGAAGAPEPRLGGGGPLTDRPDPVMSADRNLDFRVTHDEYIAQLRSVFSRLDENHDGSLSRPEALASCR